MSSILLAATNFFGGEAFEAGTAMLFNMSTAPTGWTKDTTYDNRAFRVITGTVAVGGNIDFTAAFPASKAVNSTTTTTSTMGYHNHGRPTNQSDDFSSSGASSAIAGVTGGANSLGIFISNPTGNSGSHNHTLSMQVMYVDTIIASKAA